MQGSSFADMKELERRNGTMKLRHRNIKASSSSEDESAGPAGDWKKAPELDSGSDGGEANSRGDRKSKCKGVQGLIKINNPNRVNNKALKLSMVDLTLSQSKFKVPKDVQKQGKNQKLLAETKTEEIRSDLARLAIVRKEREEAARKREEEKKEKEKLKLAAKKKLTK